MDTAGADPPTDRIYDRDCRDLPGTPGFRPASRGTSLSASRPEEQGS